MQRRALLGGLLAAAVGAPACRRPTQDARGRTVLRLWHSMGGRNRGVLLDVIERFHRAQDRAVVEPVYQGDYFETLAKLRTAVAAGAAPALSHVVAEVMPYLAEAKALEPLDDHAGMRELDLVAPLAQKGAFHGGGERPLLGIPFNRSTPIAYVNGELFQREGVPVPTTWSELRDAAKALTQPGVRWGHEAPIAWWFWVALVTQAGEDVWGPGAVPTLGGEAGIRALRFWQDLVHRDHAMRPPPGRDYDAWNATNQDFLAGRAACVWTSTAYLRYLEENARFPVVAAPLPREVRRGVPTGGTFFVVLRHAPEPEKVAAASFLRFVCEPENAAMLAERTGYLPITEGAVRRLEGQGFFAKHPNDAVAQRQLADVAPWPWEKQLFRVERDIVDPLLEEAVLLDRDAREVLTRARDAATRPA